MARRHPLTAAYRWEVASRCLAAALGGFLLASAAGILLAALLMRSGLMTRPDALQTATLVSFVVWCAAVMWAFQTRRWMQAWAHLLLPALAMAAVAGLLMTHSP